MVKYIIWQPLFMTNQQTRTKQTKEADIALEPTLQVKRELLFIYGRIADIYQTLGQKNMALEICEKAKAIAEDWVAQNPTSEARSHLSSIKSRMFHIQDYARVILGL